jgi:hypothetical protein
MRAFAGLSRGGGPRAKAHGHHSLYASETGVRAVFSDRIATGFSGLIVVTIILLAVQLLTGVEAFPL